MDENDRIQITNRIQKIKNALYNARNRCTTQQANNEVENQIRDWDAKLNVLLQSGLNIPQMSMAESQEFNEFIPALEDQIKQSKTASDVIEAVTKGLSKAGAKA
jgi:hypothetical protein